MPAPFAQVGKRIRLSRILKDGRAVVFAFDHGVEHGPGDFPPEHVDPRAILGKVVEAGVDAIMMLPGMAALTHEVWANRASLIVKVTSKTSLRPEDQGLLQSVFGYVEDAVALGAEAVAATVYWGSPYEDAMLEQWFAVRERAEEYGLPCLQLAYPRGPTIKNRHDVEIVRYGVRAAIESGADLIKTYYTGSRETFAEVVKVAAGVPVLMSGGAARSRPLDFLVDVWNVMQAGASGVVVGRNVFQHRNPAGMVKAIMAIVHEGRSPEEVAHLAQ
ncbi:MAG: class I fructose-bisphosphate aldolase [Desulfurococcaceae archaeon]